MMVVVLHRGNRFRYICWPWGVYSLNTVSEVAVEAHDTSRLALVVARASCDRSDDRETHHLQNQLLYALQAVTVVSVAHPLITALPTSNVHT